MSKNENQNKNLVYIIDCDGNELPPTSRRGRVRKLLDSGQAVVVKKKPFTIKLKYDCYNDFQKEEKKVEEKPKDTRKTSFAKGAKEESEDVSR